MESNAFYSVRGLLLKSLPVRAEVQAGSACRTLRARLKAGSAGQPAFMRRHMAAGDFMGSRYVL